MITDKKEVGEVAFTYCVNFGSAETKTTTWDKFAATVSRSEQFETKAQSIRRAAIVGGVRSDEKAGRADNVASRTILALDYDDFPLGTNIAEIEFALEMALGCSFVAYSTFRHTLDAPRIRVMAPLSRQVSAAEYPLVVAAIAAQIGLEGLDECSDVINQIMFLASHSDGVEPWAMVGGDGALDVDGLGIDVGGIVTTVVADDVFDLDLALSAQPLDLSDDDVAALLDNYPADSIDYAEWAKVGMAISHQYSNSDEGFAIWVEWSRLDSERFNEREMRTKWRSFRGGRANPVTMASVIKAVGGLKGGAMVMSPTSEAVTTLRDTARSVSTMAEYGEFKKRVTELSNIQLPQDLRSVLASEVHKIFAKGEGMGLRDVKTAFAAPKGKRPVDSEGDGSLVAPEWLEPWAYHTADNMFVNSDNPALGMNKEAFNVKFSAAVEPMNAELRPADYAVTQMHIHTIDRLFFMPDTTERFCERNGFNVMNTYRRGGVSPCATMDDEGQAVVDLFLQHVAWTFPNPVEQTLLIDWMAHLYQNQGQRVNWAMLIWGVQGSGKTLFFNILQQLIGTENTKDISPSSVKTDYNDWAVGGILGCIEEIRVSGANKWAVMDTMKPAITNDTLAINPKGKTSYSGAPNFCSYMMLTNHQDAIPVDDGDRRFCVLFSAHNDREALEQDHGGEDGLSDYFKRLFEGCVHRRADAMARFLRDYKISSAFDHKGRAPRTSGFVEMVDANTSDESRAIDDLLSDYTSPIFNKDIICITELKALAALHSDIDMPTTRAMGVLLREKGFRPVGPRCFKALGTKHYVWTKPTKVDDEKAKDILQNYYAGDEDFSDVPF